MAPDALAALLTMPAERKPSPLRREPMGKLNVDTALIETLAELLQRTGLTEIELAEGDSRIRVVRAPQPLTAAVPAPRSRRTPPASRRPLGRRGGRRRPRPSAIRARCTRRWSARSI